MNTEEPSCRVYDGYVLDKEKCMCVKKKNVWF